MSLLPLVFPLINLDDFLPNGGKVILRSSRLTALGTDRKEGGEEEGVEVRGPARYASDTFDFPD